MLGMNMQRVQQRQHLRAEETIQECGKSQLFHFLGLRLRLRALVGLTDQDLKLTTSAVKPCTLPTPPLSSGLPRARTTPTKSRETPPKNS